MKPTVELCPNCGSPPPPDAPAGLCPGCLVKGGFGLEGSPEERGIPDSGSSGTLHIAIPEGAPFEQGAPKRLGSYELPGVVAPGGMG